MIDEKTMAPKIFESIFDRRLYGTSFIWISGPLLAVGLATQILIYLVLNKIMIWVYVPLFAFLVLISGLGSKNVKAEFYNIGHFRGFLFLLASALASTVPFILPPQANSAYNLYQFFLTFAVSNVALTIAIVEVTVLGQRVSLRESAHLDGRFFTRQEKLWQEQLKNFPNKEKIVSCLHDGRPIPTLFERGSFVLVVLWSCIVMEQIINAATDGIIKNDPTKKHLFRTEKGLTLKITNQLKNLNYVHRGTTGRKGEQISIEDLWNKVRNPIAHDIRRPSFGETYGALTILISFIQDFPKTLETWQNDPTNHQVEHERGAAYRHLSGTENEGRVE